MRKEFIFILPRGTLKRNYCSNCGERMIREKIHRIEHDKSHMGNRTYQKKVDTHITEHQFKCPNCLNRYGSDDQGVISIIQKRMKRKKLSPEEIRNHYHSAFTKYRRRGNIRTFLFLISIFSIGLLLICLYFKTQGLQVPLSIYFFVALLIAFTPVIAFKEDKFRSPEAGLILDKLYAMSFNNKKLISEGTVCHCFKCRSSFDGGEVKRFDTDGVSALCPKCGTRSVIMENDYVEITKDTIMEMHYHWCREPRF